MEFVLRIKTENEAFALDARPEVARILRLAARSIESGYMERGESLPLHDINGNDCGSVAWKDRR